MALALHEPREQLGEKVLDEHRAITSLIEELEAVTWYQQRASATKDESLRALLEHNRNEEIEHASMLLEYLRRNYPQFQEKFKTYLFTTAPITEIEEAADSGGGDGPGNGESASSKAGAAAGQGGLNIGSLKGA